jgi:hypothetical protein
MHRESRPYTRLSLWSPTSCFETGSIMRAYAQVQLTAYIEPLSSADYKRCVSAFSHVFGGQLTTMTATTILCCPADKKDVLIGSTFSTV